MTPRRRSPRRVRTRTYPAGMGCAMWVVTLAALPFALMGLYILGVFVVATLLAVFGGGS